LALASKKKKKVFLNINEGNLEKKLNFRTTGGVEGNFQLKKF
jgi:hypothetical protein